MDYGVKYNILVNGTEASKEFTKFADVISAMSPKIIKDISGINTTLLKTIRLVKELDILLKGPAGRRKLSIDTAESERELLSLKKQLAAIKSKTITVTTKSIDKVGTAAAARVPGVPGSSRASGARRPGGSFRASNLMPTGFLAGIGLPMIAMGGAALAGRGVQTMIKDAALFEDTMSTVKNILKTGDKEAATFDERFASVSRTIQKVGVDTRFTSTEIAGAAKYLAMAGMELESVEAAMKPVANLAALSDAPIDRVADTITNIMAGFNIQAKGLSGVSDVIAAASISTNTNVLEMAEAFKFASGPLSLARIRFEEGAAAIGILANAGIKGTLAGTAIRAMMIRLIAPTTKAQKTLTRLGVSTTEVVNGIEKVKDIATVFKDLKKANASVEDLYKIFDKIGGNAATALYTYTNRLVELTKAAEYSGGLAGYLAAEKMKTIIGLTDQITSQIQYLSQTAFLAIEPLVKKYMNEFNDWLKTPDAAGFFSTVVEGIRGVTVALTETSRFIYQNWDVIKWIIGGGAMAKTIFGVVQGFMGIAGALTTIGGAAAGASVTMGGLTAGLMAMVSGPAVLITAVVTAIGLFVAKIYEAKSKSDDLVQSMQVPATYQTLDSMKAALDGISRSADIAKMSVKDLTKERLSTKPSGGTMMGQFKSMAAEAGYGVADWFMPGAGNTLRKFDANNIYKEDYVSEAYKIKDDLVLSTLNPILTNFQKDFASSTPEVRSKMISDLEKFRNSSKPSSSDKRIDDLSFMPGVTGEKDIKNTFDYKLGAYKEISAQVEWAKEINKLTSSNSASENLKALSALGVTNEFGYKSFKDPLSGEIDNTKVQAAFQSMINKHFLTDDVIRMFKNIGIDQYLKADPGQTFTTTPSITTAETPEEALKRMTAEDRAAGGVGGLSGAGRMSGSGGGKNITVNIQNLMSIENASLQGKDLDEVKDKMAQALMDIVKEFEISYS